MDAPAANADSLRLTALAYLKSAVGCQLDFSGNDAVIYYLGQLSTESGMPDEALNDLVISTATQGATGPARDAAFVQACRINDAGFQMQLRFLFETCGVVAGHNAVRALIVKHTLSQGEMRLERER